MKITIAVFILLLLSCTILDRDGFKLWNFSDMSQEWYVVQSHSGYFVEGSRYFEWIFESPVNVKNESSETINVRIWYNGKFKYVNILPFSEIYIGGQ